MSSQPAVDSPRPPEPGPWAIVVNPTKFDDLDAVRAQCVAAGQAAGWPEPMWVESTAEDPGEGMARDAVAKGARLVCALGGDGTVRSVAEGLAGSEAVLGLLPGGTGNLLARNLDQDVDDLDVALRVALTGSDRRIDVGRIVARGADASSRPGGEIFLVMAGVGFDADMMEEAPEGLKKVVGWAAYVVSGAKAMLQRGFRLHAQLDGDPHTRFQQHARGVIVGNCGTLTGGMELMPDALVDDGILEVVTLSPKGLMGWAAVAEHVLTRKRHGHRGLRRDRCKGIELRLPRPVRYELDGDTVGECTSFEARVSPGALVVRVG